MTPELKIFVEWIRQRPGGFAFQLNKVCDRCIEVSPVTLLHGGKWYCGKCWNDRVEYVEPIQR